MRKIFLSGGSGFIGKNVLGGLGGKYNFYSPSHKQLNLLDFELVNKYFSKYGPFDAVLHTAIIGGNRMTGDSREFALDSLRMFFNLASQDKYFKRFFYFGSGIEYGKEKPIRRAGEVDFGKLVPASNWGLYKYICAKYVEDSNKFVNLRLFGVFGKYEDYRIRFISNSICKSILNMPIDVNQNIIMDYLYIDDLVRILELFLKTKLKYKTYNITSGKGTDLITVAKKINSISKGEVPIRVRKTGLSPEYTASNLRLRNEFRDIKFTDINEAINMLYEWYFKRKDKIKNKDLIKDYF
ncbi:MAG: NAD(P)-dependent oxidoreductase [Candidatus Curtissbacteria bacterium]|nr:NAD(P)-dependent oxidoreductase [Candidatus Curtissbacteria bacterium]